MSLSVASSPLTARLVEALYSEALLLADETRHYFDEPGQAERDRLAPAGKVVFACEALRGTTRLMQVIAWLLMRRAIDCGELAADDPRAADRRLGEVAALDAGAVADLPATARRLLLAGADLYERVRRLDDGFEEPGAAPSPARSLLQRLERSL